MFLPLRRAATMVLPTTEASNSERVTPSITLGSSATTHLIIFFPTQFSSTALLAASTSGSSGIAPSLSLCYGLFPRSFWGLSLLTLLTSETETCIHLSFFWVPVPLRSCPLLSLHANQRFRFAAVGFGSWPNLCWAGLINNPSDFIFFLHMFIALS